VVAGQKPTDFRAERFDGESKRVTVIVGPGDDALLSRSAGLVAWKRRPMRRGVMLVVFAEHLTASEIV